MYLFIYFFCIHNWYIKIFEFPVNCGLLSLRIYYQEIKLDRLNSPLIKGSKYLYDECEYFTYFLGQPRYKNRDSSQSPDTETNLTGNFRKV